MSGSARFEHAVVASDNRSVPYLIAVKRAKRKQDPVNVSRCFLEKLIGFATYWEPTWRYLGLLKAIIEEPFTQIRMKLDQESKLDIGIGVTLRYVLAIRIELEHMSTTVLTEQSRVERSADVVNAGVRLLPYRPADHIAEPLVSLFCQSTPTSCILVLLSKPLRIRREPCGLGFNLLAPPDMVVNAEVL